jgi:hypothetical protein
LKKYKSWFQFWKSDHVPVQFLSRTDSQLAITLGSS